jgi:hypothetical protein
VAISQIWEQIKFETFMLGFGEVKAYSLVSSSILTNGFQLLGTNGAVY